MIELRIEFAQLRSERITRRPHANAPAILDDRHVPESTVAS